MKGWPSAVAKWFMIGPVGGPMMRMQRRYRGRALAVDGGASVWISIPERGGELRVS